MTIDDVRIDDVSEDFDDFDCVAVVGDGGFVGACC